METFRESFPVVLGATGTGVTLWMNEYGLPWIGAICGILTIVNLILVIKGKLKNK